MLQELAWAIKFPWTTIGILDSKLDEPWRKSANDKSRALDVEMLRSTWIKLSWWAQSDIVIPRVYTLVIQVKGLEEYYYTSAQMWRTSEPRPA